MRMDSLGRKALVLSGILVVSLVVVLFSNIPRAVADPRLFEDGFETGDLSKWTTGYGNRSVTSGDAHHGSYKAVLNESEEYEQAWFTPVDHCFMRAYVMFKSFPPVGLDTPILGVYNRSNPHFYMAEARVGNFAGIMKWRLRFFNSGVSYSVTSEQQKPVLDTWYSVEVEGKSNSTANAEARIYINGNELTDVSRTGINNTRTINSAYIWESVTGGVIQWYDCIVVDTDYIGPECALNVNVVGSGSVAKSPDQSFYNWGTNVTLTATAATGWSFDHWNGDASGTVNPITVNMTSDKEVTATFTQNEYALTVTTVGSGAVNLNNTGPYHYGDVVELIAVPSAGWGLDHWEGDLTGSVSPAVLTITGDMSVTAVFTRIQYSLTVSVSPFDSGSVSLNATGPYHYGDVVELTAVPAVGYNFDYWSDDLSGSTNPSVITIDGNKVVTANFVQLEYSLTVTVDPIEAGSVILNNTGPYHYGDWVRLTAVANLGWSFSQWSGDASGTDNPVDVFIDGDKLVTANFTRVGYVLTVTVVGHGVTNVTGTQVYDEFTNVTVLASPASGSYFDHWLLDSVDVGSMNPYTVNMTTDYDLTAVFVAYQRTLTVTVVGNGSTNATGIFSYDLYSNATVLATPDLGYRLDYWILNGSVVGSVNPYTLNMTANFDLTAVFSPIMRSLTVSVVGNGVTNATGTQSYAQFTNVTVLATPSSGWMLDHWTLNGTVYGAASLFTVNMTSSIDLVAVFTPIQYSLTVSVLGPGSTNATGTLNYDAFSNVTVLATPASGWLFDHWILNHSNVGSVNPYTLNMTGNFDLTAVFTPIQYSYLVVRGDDNRIYYRVYDSSSSSWGDWNALPEGSTLDSPAAAVYSGKLYFVVRGMDGYSLWYSWISLTDYSFSGWTWLSGATESQPTLTSYDTQLILVVRGLDNSIYYRFYDCVADVWGDWNAVPAGSTPDTPAATVLGDGLHFVVRGMDGYSLWHSWINLTDYSFSGWTGLSGATSSRPALTASQSLSKLHLVVRGLDDGIYSMDYDESGDSWGSWSGIPGATCDGPSVCVLNSVLKIVVRGIDGNMLWYWDGSNWTWISGSTPSAPTLKS